MSNIIPEQITRLIDARIQHYLANNSRLSVSAIEGKGGDVVVSAFKGDIHVRTMAGYKAYYNGVEIGSGGGAGTNADTLDSLHASAFVRKDVGAGDQLEYNKIYMNAMFVMEAGNEIRFFSNAAQVGSIVPKAAIVELLWYYGIQISPPSSESTIGNLYIGNTRAAPSGKGVFILETGINIVPMTDTLRVYGATWIQQELWLGGLVSDPAGSNGRIYYNSTSNKFRAYEAGSWRNLIGVDGTGTAKRIPKWTGLYAIGDSAIEDDSTTGYVTIGQRYLKLDYTTTPQLQLYVSGVHKGRLYATGSDLVLECPVGNLYLATAVTTGGYISLETKAVQRMKIEDALISTTVEFRSATHITAGNSDPRSCYLASFSKNTANMGGVYFKQYTDSDNNIIGYRKWGLWGYLKKTTDGTTYAWESFISCEFPTAYDVTFTKLITLNAPVTLGGAIAMATYDITGTGNVIPHEDSIHYCGSGSYFWIGCYADNFYIGDVNTFIKQTAGDFEIHIALNKKVKIIVG